MGPAPQAWEGEGSASESPTFSPLRQAEVSRTPACGGRPLILPKQAWGPILLPQGEKDKNPARCAHSAATALGTMGQISSRGTMSKVKMYLAMPVSTAATKPISTSCASE